MRLPCVVLVGWVGDCAIVVWCVVWVGLFELCFGAWLGNSCCVIACVRFLLASFVLVRVSCSCVGVCLPFVGLDLACGSSWARAAL